MGGSIMDEKKTPVVESAEDRKKWKPVEYIGLVLVLAFLACIFFAHEQFSGAFNAMFA